MDRIGSKLNGESVNLTSSIKKVITHLKSKNYVNALSILIYNFYTKFYSITHLGNDQNTQKLVSNNLIYPYAKNSQSPHWNNSGTDNL